LVPTSRIAPLLLTLPRRLTFTIQNDHHNPRHHPPSPHIHQPCPLLQRVRIPLHGKGFGAAFEFLFDTTESREEGDAEENRIDKLRKDLVFMWRS
jgi:hypothetical protein